MAQRPITLTLVRPTDEPTQDDLVVIVARAVAGEVDARRLLFLRFAPELASLLRRILGARCDVEDAVQQAFLVALEQLPKLRDLTAFRPWLYRLAIRAARRTFWTRRVRELAWPTVDPLWRPEDLADGLSSSEAAQLALLGKRLAQLPLPLRQAWLVRHHFDCTLPETALVCNCSLATVKRRLAEAEARLEGLPI